MKKWCSACHVESIIHMCLRNLISRFIWCALAWLTNYSRDLREKTEFIWKEWIENHGNLFSLSTEPFYQSVNLRNIHKILVKIENWPTQDFILATYNCVTFILNGISVLNLLWIYSMLRRKIINRLWVCVIFLVIYDKHAHSQSGQH